MPFIATKNAMDLSQFRSLLSNKNGCCTSPEFLRILRNERNRCKRSGCHTTYITFDFSKIIDRINNINGEYFRVLKKIIIMISRNSREYNLKYLVTPLKIRLLLVDVTIYDAEIFIEKVLAKIYEYLTFFKKEDFNKMTKVIEISSNSSHESYTSSQVNIIEDYQRKGETTSSKTVKHNDRDIPGLFIRWAKSCASDSIMTLTAPIFWDILFRQQIYITYKFVKRGLDILGALFFIILFSPMILVTSLAIIMTSKGPILFKQERLGYWGKPFHFLKFRTMYTDCDVNRHRAYVKKLIKGENGAVNLGTKERPYYKLTKDPRITPLGRILRQSSLDEIPQFFNVLKGDMSLIGPRPPIPYEVEEYKKWHFRRLFQVKPGITGLWQVSGRNRTTFDEMVRLDIQYAQNLSFLLDLKILLKTFKAVFALDGK